MNFLPKSILSFVSLLICELSYSQISPSRFWIRFTDKNNSPYSITDPGQFLSQRAIDRRKNQNINIDAYDLPVNSFYVDSIRNKGVLVFNRSKWFNSVIIDTTGSNDSTVIQKVLALPFVQSVKSVGKKKKTGANLYPVKRNKNPLPPDAAVENNQVSAKIKFFIQPDSLKDDYGESFVQLNMLSGDILHQRGYKGKGIWIAVIDAGFYKADILGAFDSLRARGGVIATHDFVDQEDSVYEDATHGMQVLSTMAAILPGQLIGTAPWANYLLLRSEAPNENPVEELNWVAAAEFADSAGADILTTSLGYTVFDDPADNHSYADMDGNTTPITMGADRAASRGMLVVNAAGNEGNSSWKYIAAAADGDSVMAVGAVDVAANYASFSSKGPSYDGRIKPDVAAMGSGTVVASTSGGVGSGNGTSLAAPLISGLAACLWQSNPKATGMQIFDAIRQSANQYAHPDTLLGYGIPNFEKADLLLKGDNPDTINTDKIIKIYPNPFTNELLIIFYANRPQEISFQLADLTGRTLFTGSQPVSGKSYNTFSYDGLGFLNNGIYILRITYSTGNKIIKLIKQ